MLYSICNIRYQKMYGKILCENYNQNIFQAFDNLCVYMSFLITYLFLI